MQSEIEAWSKTNATDDTPLDPPFGPGWEETYLQRVFDEIITKKNLDPGYHDITTEYLLTSAYKGFGGDPSHFTQGSPEWTTIQGIKKNIFQFSAAKQYQQVRIMSDFIYDKGLKAPYSEFKKLAGQVFGEFNQAYLKTEYTTAIGQAQSARDWANFEQHADTHPWLKYHTQQDNRVREDHAILDGFTARIDDPAWRHIAPKNGWRCRCFLTSQTRGKRTDQPLPKSGTNEFPAVFDMNPGIDKLVFDPKTHPYFFVEKGDRKLKKQNFGLPDG